MKPRLLSPAIFAPTRRAVGPLDWLVCGITTRHAVIARESRRDLAARLPGLAGLGAVRVVLAEQVHGRRIAVITQGNERNGPAEGAERCGEPGPVAVADLGVRGGADAHVVEIPPGRKEAGDPVEAPGVDGLIVAEPEVLVAVSTADCVPIVLADERARRVAVLHAGRESTRLGIVPNAMECLRSLGSRPQDMRVWIGPSISAARYEVSRAIAEEFRARFGRYDGATTGPEGRHLDLAEINRRELMSAGLHPDRIERDPRCTFERDDLFFSYRRDCGVAGRMLAFAVIVARPGGALVP